MEKKELKIEMSPEMAQGKYANLTVISHSGNGFFIDNICMMPNSPQAQVVSRVIMTPEVAKQFMFALNENIAKYESVFGEITQRVPANIPQGFPTPNCKA